MSKQGQLIAIADDQEGKDPTIVTPHFPLPVTDYWLQHAINVIYGTYGDVVSVEDKDKDLLKNGRSEQVDNTAGGTTIMTLPTGTRHEPEIYSNLIDSVSSTNIGDAGKTLVVEGHTYSAGDLTFVVQDVILDATNPTTTAVTLTTPLARSTRSYLKSSGTAGSPQSDLLGDIYFYDDTGGVTLSSGVPSAADQVHMMIRAGENKTEKASTSISSTDYWIVTGAYCDMLDKNSGAAAEVLVQTRDVGNGGVYLTQFEMKCSHSGGGAYRTGYPYIIIPKNHDIRMVGLGDSATDRAVQGGIFGTLATIVT